MKRSIARLARKLFGVSALVILFSGCIPSLQPLYSEKDVVFDKGLVGSWSEKEDSAVWAFSKGDGQSYQLTIEEKGNSSPFLVHLFKLDEQLYLDLYPGDKGFEDWNRETFFKAAVVPGHLFFKVGKIGEKFTIYAMQSEWLKQLLDKDATAVPHSKIAEDRLVFTGSTEEMQKFLRKYQDDHETWGDPAEFKRVEKSGSK